MTGGLNTDLRELAQVFEKATYPSLPDSSEMII